MEAGQTKSDYQTVWPMLLDYNDDECRCMLRNLELTSYALIVNALRAQGPLTDNKKSVMKELRKLLSISVDRHKAEVRRAVNDEELATISDWIWGSGVDDAWVTEGRRVVGVKSRPIPETLFTDMARQVACKHQQVNDRLPPPSKTGSRDTAYVPPPVSTPTLSAPVVQSLTSSAAVGGSVDQAKSSTGRKQSHARHSPPPPHHPSSRSASTGSLITSSSSGLIFTSTSTGLSGFGISSSGGSVVLTEAPQTSNYMDYANISQGYDSHHFDTGVVIDTQAAEVPHADDIIETGGFQMRSPNQSGGIRAQQGVQHRPPHSRPVFVVNKPSGGEDYTGQSSGKYTVRSQSSSTTPLISNIHSLQGANSKMVTPSGSFVSMSRLPSNARIFPVTTTSMSTTSESHTGEVGSQGKVSQGAGPGARKPNIILVQKPGSKSGNLETLTSSSLSSAFQYRILGVPQQQPPKVSRSLISPVSGVSASQHADILGPGGQARIIPSQQLHAASLHGHVRQGISPMGSNPSTSGLSRLGPGVPGRPPRTAVDLDEEEDEGGDKRGTKAAVGRPRIPSQDQVVSQSMQQLHQHSSLVPHSFSRSQSMSPTVGPLSRPLLQVPTTPATPPNTPIPGSSLAPSLSSRVPGREDDPPVIDVSVTGEMTVAEKRSRPGDGSPSWAQLALSLLNKFHNFWRDMPGPGVSPHVDSFSTIRQKLQRGQYSCIGDFDTDIQVIKQGSLKLVSGDEALRSDTNDAFSFYDYEYNILLDKLNKSEGINPVKRPRLE